MAWSLLILLCLSLLACSQTEPPQEPALISRLGQPVEPGYARAEQPRRFEFPADHGPHPDFRTEWWYLTGNLQDQTGRRFGYQITFFRNAISPNEAPSGSDWRTRQIWMAHLALSDAASQTHHAEERFARQALGLAGARAEPFAVWLEDWRLEAKPDGGWRLHAETDDFGLTIELTEQRPIVLQGEAGLSQKSAEPGNASYYYSMTRLASQGQVRVGEESFTVSGASWLDREWSTSALGSDQAGWDWFALQFDDARDLMFYRLRRQDGATDPHSAGSLADQNGLSRRLGTDDLGLEPLRWWTGSGGASYPVHWRLSLGGETFGVEAVFDDQLMDLTARYWEGMVEVRDASGQRVGRGYLELAGY